MTRVLPTIAVLLLAACETGGTQHTSGALYPVAAPSIPVEATRPQPAECPIKASRDWSAWINAMPGPTPPRLVVSGKVVTASGRYEVAFDRLLQVRAPAQAFVVLEVAEPDRAGAGTSITHEVRWEWPVNQPIGSVVVSCGDKTLAEITNIQTAY